MYGRDMFSEVCRQAACMVVCYSPLAAKYHPCPSVLCHVAGCVSAASIPTPCAPAHWSSVEEAKALVARPPSQTTDVVTMTGSRAEAG